MPLDFFPFKRFDLFFESNDLFAMWNFFEFVIGGSWSVTRWTFFGCIRLLILRLLKLLALFNLRWILIVKVNIVRNNKFDIILFVCLFPSLTLLPFFFDNILLWSHVARSIFQILVMIDLNAVRFTDSASCLAFGLVFHWFSSLICVTFIFLSNILCLRPSLGLFRLFVCLRLPSLGLLGLRLLSFNLFGVLLWLLVFFPLIL